MLYRKLWSVSWSCLTNVDTDHGLTKPESSDEVEVDSMRKFISLLSLCWLVTTGVGRAQTLDKEMSALAANLTKALVAQGSKNVAAIDFTDLQGQPTELGRFLSEQLSVEMVLAGGVSMLDRGNIKSILAEHKLTEEGLVNPANARKLGEFAGVDTILIGSVTSLDAGFVLTVKAISAETSKIVAAGKITFQKTPDLQGIGNRGLPRSASGTSTPPDSAAGYQEANAIATKDIGSLRVDLKSVMPMKLKDQNGQTTNGIRLSFDFTSRETRRVIVVGMNATNQHHAYNYTFNSQGPSFGDCGLGLGLRSSLVDSNGNSWSYSSVTGVSIVGVGCAEREQDPSDIASLLAKQDRLNGASLPNQSQYVYGSPSAIDPGQTASVVMTFILNANGQRQASNPQSFQFASEIVVGVVTTEINKSYSLQNLTFDRVAMPAR